MTPACLNQDHAPFEEGEQDRSGRLPPFSPMTPAFLFPCSVIFNSSPDQRETGHQQQLERGSIDVVLASTINNNNNSSSNNFYYYDKSSNTIGQLSNDGYYGEDVHGSVQCMSSKMRLMRKTMKSDGIVTSKAAKSKQVRESKQQEQCINDRSNNSSPNAADIRMCFDCNTTKTPLWRSGPAGPKSLCNACGIRQRKARRAMEAAAAVSGGLLPTDRPAGKVLKEKISVGSCTLPCKRPYEIINAGTSKKKLPVDDIMQGLNQKSAFHKVFAQDERDAAILLMALSCGHIHG